MGDSSRCYDHAQWDADSEGGVAVVDGCICVALSGSETWEEGADIDAVLSSSLVGVSSNDRKHLLIITENCCCLWSCFAACHNYHCLLDWSMGIDLIPG